MDNPVLRDDKVFAAALFEIMSAISPAVAELELYEFCYGLDNLTPADGWEMVTPADPAELDKQIHLLLFFEQIQSSPIVDGRIQLDPQIVLLTRMLLRGLVSGDYSIPWVRKNFFFDIRSFLFYVRTHYYTPKALEHLGGRPYLQFDPEQKQFAGCWDIGYKAMRLANHDIDGSFFDVIGNLIQRLGTPVLFTLAGPTGAGKTEIVERLLTICAERGHHFSTLGMDHFFKDREYRDSVDDPYETIHFGHFEQAMQQISNGEPALIPRYDFYKAVSSHNHDGSLRPGGVPQLIEPADVIFLEGNFPFHLSKIARWIGIKIVYLTDDPERLKRKWKRDIDYRKKYNENYFCNRFFKTQALRAAAIYRPLIEVCDLVVDTTAASIWLTPEMKGLIAEG